MNVCDINQNREFANSIADYISASIKESLESKQPFKLFTILDEVFKAVDEGETEPTKALGAATMVPQLFFEVLELEKGLNSGLAEQGFDIRIVKTLEKALAESNDPVTLMAEVLNKTKIPTIEQMVNNNLAPSTSNAKIIERVVGTLKGFFDNVMFSFSMFNTTGRSVLKTTAYSVEKSNPNRILEYNVLQNLLSIDNDTNKPFDKIEYSGHTGFKLKVIQEKNIIDPAKNIYPGETPGEGFITILVNNKGEYYYFNGEGNITTPDKGKLVYFPLKSTKQENIDKVIEGMIKKFKSLTQKEAAADPIMYANQLVAKTLEIKNQVNKEVQSLKEIEASVRQGDNVLLKITGGSLGIMQNPEDLPNAQLKKAAERPYSAFKIDPKIKNKIFFDNFKDAKGIVNKTPAVNIFNKLITLKGTNVSQNAPEVLDKMVNILVDDLTYSDNKEVSPEDRVRLFSQFTSFSQRQPGYLDTKGLHLAKVNGKLEIQVNGNFVNTSDKEGAKAILKNHLKNAFFTYISNSKTDKLDVYDNFYIDNGILTVTEEPYRDFIFKHLIPRMVYDETTGKPMIANGYFKFELDNIEEVVQKKVEEVLAKSEKIVDKKKKDSLKGLDDILGRSRLIEARATPEQKIAGDKWSAEAQILKAKDKDGKPLLTITDARDIVNSDAFATFANATVTLYKGFNSTHMYHEAWHVFSQMYLTYSERTNKLYKPASNLEGSFTVVRKFGGPGGNTAERVRVNFADLKADLESSDPDVVSQARLDLEEFIAEEFRKYAMNGGTFKVKDTKANIFEKIFKRIWDFFKALFKGSLPVNVYSNPGSNGVFSEMFNALYTAKEEKDLNMYMPSINNAEFGTLNLGIMAPNGRTLLSGIDAQLLSNSIDGIISEITTNLILGNPSEEIKPRYGAALQIFANPDALAYIYNVEVKTKLTKRLNKLIEEKEKNESSWNIFERDYHINNIRVLHQGLKHFGNLNDIVKNKTAENSIVAYHLQNSAFKESIRKGITDPTDVDSTDLASYLARTMDKSGNEVASEKLATSNALYIIQSLIKQEYDKEGNAVDKLNSLGFPETIDFLPFWNFLMNKVSGEQNIEDLYNKMVSVTNIGLNPLMEQLLLKLGDPNVVGVANKNAGNIWLGILSSLNLANVDLINFVARQNKKGEYDVTVGKVSADYFKIKNSVWKNKFSTETSKYVKLDKDKENVLILDEIVKDFLDKNLDSSNTYRYSLKKNKAPIDFFNAIGLYMSSNQEVVNKIDYETINQLADAIGQAALNGAVIKNTVKYFDEVHKIYVEKLIKGKVEGVSSYLDKGQAKSYVISPLTSRINALAQLEADYSIEYGSQMKPVSGGKKSIYTLNSTLSKIMYGLRKAAGIDDLIDYKYLQDHNGNYGYMPHLHPINNPALKGSVYHRNLFDKSGKKIEGAELEMFELVGAQIINEDGKMEDASHRKMTDGDTFKVNLFSFLSEGYMEAVRSAGKSTYYAARMNNIITYAYKKSNHLFIDTEAFIKNKNGEYIFGINPIKELNNIMLPKLEGELRRIVKLSKGITEEQAIELGLDPKKTDLKNFYKNNVKGFEFGDKFDWFHDILESEEGGKIKQKLISEYGPKLTDTNSIIDLLNEDLEFKELIEERISTYFENYKNRLRKDYDVFYKAKQAYDSVTKQPKTILNIPSYLKKVSTQHLSPSQLSTISDEAILDGLLMSYAVNSGLHSDEIITIEFGDGFQFDHSKNEGPKRIPTYNSPGKIFASDNITKNILNIHYGRPYEAKLIAEGKIAKTEVRKFERVGNKFIISEPVGATSRYDQYHDLFLTGLNKRNYTEDEIKELMYGIKDGKYGNKDIPFGGSIMDTWANIKYADGQGLISFDYYRLLHANEDNWSPAQEAAFQKEINGEFIPPQDLTELFPAYKLQHAGALATPKGMYPIQSIDKFALLPAIPSLMKDTNYEIIHNQMVAQDGDYLLFPSGSKRSHIKAGKDINGDQIYDGTTAKLKPEFINGTLKLTKNPFFVDYLKNQTEVNNYFKDESTLSTQFRKVFNTGIYENGLPIDFTGTKEEWDKLSYKKKLETSRIHRKTEAVFSRLEKLTTELKYDLLDEMGVDHVKGKFDLNPDSITNMIGYLTKKLKAQGYSDHQLSILNSENGKAPNLSLSPEAPRLEKLLMAVINNRLVRLKLFGEAYVQTSSAFFEPFTNATEEQKETHDDFREEGGYVVDPTGKENTKGCKVKVALTDNYKNLYKTSYFIKDENGNYVNSGETIAVYDKVEGKKNKVLNEQASFNRLNEMLKVQEWKNDDSNRQKIHISGVRIPTQGPNSVEFAEIWEFLTPAAGPIIIIPREVVAKSGGDFDVDKLTMYIKRISRQGSLIEDTYKDKEAILPEIESLKNKLKELKADKLTIDNSLESFRKQVYYAFNYVEMTNEQKRNFTTRDNKSLLETLQNPENQKFLKSSIKRAYKIYNKEIKSFNVSEYEDVEGIMNDLYGKNSELAKTFKKLSDLEDHSNHFSSAIGNSLVDDFIQVLELPEMAFSLLLPNGTYLVKKYSDELKEAVQLSDKQTNYQNSIQTGNKISDISAGISPTRLREVDFNRQIKQDNITGKDVLGILALDTPFNNLNNMAGTMMESSIPEEIMVFNQETNKNDIITLNTPVYLKLNHNSKEVMEAGRRLLEISLSDLTDAEKKNQIADVFNQLINGAVDVEKDPWIAYVQGNMEVIPKMVFLLQAGVPFADLAYFFTNPLTRSYVRFSKEVKSPLGQLAYGPNYSAYRLIKGFKSKYLAPAKKLVEKETTGAEDTLYELHKMLDEYTRQMPTENVFDTQSLREVAFSSLEFSDKDIKNDIPQKQLAGFLQYLYVEKLIEDYDFMKKAINVDTNVTNTTYMAASKLRDLSKADKLKSIKKGALRFFVKEGPLRSFHVQDFALELIGDTFFPSRSNRKIDDFLLEISDRIPGQMSKLKQIEKQTGFDEESFEPRYKNALSLFAFTNALGQYKKGDVLYKGHPINELLGEGSAVTSINQIIADFDSKKYSQSYKEQDSYLNRGLYPIPLAALRNLNETDFIDINLEREYLRKYVTPFTATFVKSKEFQLTKKRLLETETPIFSKMDSESFNRLTYEFMLMHNSLLNTYNNWEMFSSGNNTVAQRLIDIVDNYGASIKPDYKVLLERFGLDSSQATEKLNARRNFYIKNIKDIEQVAGDYNGIWKKLANPSMPKLMGDSAEVAAANNYISNFFDQLPIFAFLQTGMDPGPFSMTKIMPLDKYYGIMEEATAEFNNTQLNKKESKLILESFLELFKKNNDLAIINLRGRGVSYKKTINALINEARETVTIYSSPFVEKIGDNVYQLNDTLTDFGRTIKISDTYITSLKNAHPNATFLLTDQDFNVAFNLSTPEELEQAKTNIDTLINNLKTSDNPIIISSKGFGQSVIPISTSTKIYELQKDIKTLPIEIFNSVDVVDTVSDDILGDKDISFAMKDVFEERGITDPLLVNWAGINKAYFGNPKNIKSTKQLEELLEKIYNKKQKEDNYIEFKTNPLALKSFKEWKNALKEYPLVFQDIMLTHAIKHITNPTRKSKYVLQLSKVALTNTYGTLINKPHEANRLGKLYDMEVLATVSDAVEHEPSESGNGYWVHVPKTSRDDVRDYKTNIDLLRKLSPSTWCTASSMTETYVQNYDNYLLIVNGVTVAGIEVIPLKDNSNDIKYIENKIKILEEKGPYTIDRNRYKGDNTFYTTSIKPFTGESIYIRTDNREDILIQEEEAIKKINEDFEKKIKSLKNEIKNLIEPKQLRQVKEVTSRANNGVAPIDHLDDVIAFFEKHNLDLNNQSVKRAIKAKERGETDINVPSDFDYNIDNEYQDWLDQQERIAIDRHNGEYEDEPDWDQMEREEREMTEGEVEWERNAQFVATIDTIEEARANLPLASQHFQALPLPLRAFEDIATAAVDYDTHNITHVDSNLPFYNELAIKAVTKSPYIFIYLSPEAKEIPGLREIYDEFEGNRQVEDDLPFSKTDTNLIQGYYDAKNDKVVVVAENTPVNEGAKVAIHEVAHRGMLRMAKELGGVQELGKALFAAEDQLMKKLPQLLKRTGHKSLESLMLDYGFTTESEEGKIKLLMELAARWAETLTDKPKPSWWKQLIEKISKWITEFTGKILNEEEVNELVGGFVRYGVKSGQQAPLETARTIYTKLGNKTQSKNVILPKDVDFEADNIGMTYTTAIDFWRKIVPEAMDLYNKSKPLIVAFRGNSKKTFLQNYNSGTHTIGNPFDWKVETGTRDEQGIKSTKKFIHWMITGDNMGINTATEEYRQAIINDIKSGKLKGSSILYYQEKGYATHATALDYLINKYDWNKPTAQPQAPQNSSLNQELSLYLSEQLDKNLGYTNPGSTVVPSIKDIVNNMPNITQADINNKKLEC